MTSRLVGAVLAAAVAIGACAGGDAPPPAPDALTVEIFGPFRGTEAELLAASVVPFEEATGIDIRYTGTSDFVADLQAQVRADDPPDIALVPQPGLVREFVDAGELTALDAETLAAIEANYTEPTRALGEIDGALVGVPFQINLKSMVWYRPDVFERLGLAIPSDLDELEALSQEVEDAGIAPWCFGLGPGWPATDWTEELVLRQSGPDVYDDWTTGDVGFADPAVADGFTAFRQLVLKPGRPAGGITGVLRTSQQASPLGLLGDQPECVLHRQQGFVVNALPSDLRFGPTGDIDFFVLPGVDADQPAPLLVGSTVAVSFTDRPEVAAVMAHLATPASTSAWAQEGGLVRPHSTVDINELTLVDRAATQALRDATVLRADASDAMAPDIGSGLLWEQISRWVAEDIGYDRLATTIDAARTDPG